MVLLFRWFYWERPKSEEGHSGTSIHLGDKINNFEELNDKEDIEFIGLIGNLKTHEMERKAREEKAPQKKKTLAFKSTPLNSNEDEDDQEDDEDLSLLVKNVRRM